jgi:hypothetical protein
VTAPTSAGEAPDVLSLADLTPYFSITVLECTGVDPDVAFQALQRFLRRSADEPGRAADISIRAENALGAFDAVGELGELSELGFTGLYGVSRVVSRVPSWAGSESGVIDVINQLTIAVQRAKLVAVYTDITTEPQFNKWINEQLAPYRFIPADILASTFPGDGKMMWARGVHRRRATKADTKALGGTRLQEALDPIEDSSFALTAARVNYQPEDELAILRQDITFSRKSRISWKQTALFADFLAATAEALDLLEKSLVAGDSPDALFPQLAVRETDLSRVRGAFDITVVDPDQLRSEPDTDEEQVDRAELLRDVLLEVRGDPNSATAIVDVGLGGSVAGTLRISPVEMRGGFSLEVRYANTPSAEPIARQIKDALQDGDLLTVYYESGHTFTAHDISRQNLASSPFPNLKFEDFTGFVVTKEKPNVKGDQAIHDATAKKGDNSLFAWVVARYGRDWLLCDDGAGEIADFLHLDNEGTLTAIHVKAADNSSVNRRIAVTRFEQVVSQAEKNILLLANDTLIDLLSSPRISNRAAWNAGARVPSADFVQQLRARVATDKTRVVIVQPHLLKVVHDKARADMQDGQPSRDSHSLMLLDTLLHATRRTVTGRCEDLTVIGCA